MCVPECPVNAIVPDTDDEIDVVFWTELNQRLSDKWPNIVDTKDPLPNADYWNGKSNKLDLLEE